MMQKVCNGEDDVYIVSCLQTAARVSVSRAPLASVGIAGARGGSGRAVSCGALNAYRACMPACRSVREPTAAMQRAV